MVTAKKPATKADKKPSKARTTVKVPGKAVKSKAAVPVTKPPKDAPKGQRACTLELAKAILTTIEEENTSFREACRKNNCHTGDAWRFIHADRELDAQYARARESRGNAYGEQVAQIGLATLAGRYAPDRARVAADCLKWASGRMAPKQFGDRVVQEHTGPNGGAIQMAVFTPAQLSNLTDIEIEMMIALAAKLGIELPGVAVPSAEQGSQN